MHAGDTIVTPVNGATYKTCDFYLKFVSPDPMMSWASVNVDVQTNTGWENIGYYYGMGFEEGDVVRLADELEGFADKYTAVRITPVDLGEGEYIVVDDFDITAIRATITITTLPKASAKPAILSLDLNRRRNIITPCAHTT